MDKEKEEEILRSHHAQQFLSDCKNIPFNYGKSVISKINAKGMMLLNNYCITNLDITGSASLQDSIIINNEFRDVDFRGLNMSHSNLQNNKFDANCKFEKCNFEGSWLQNSKFIWCNMIDASFRGANIEDTDFMEAKMMGCDFTNSIMSRGTRLGKDMREAIGIYFVSDWILENYFRMVYYDNQEEDMVSMFAGFIPLSELKDRINKARTFHDIHEYKKYIPQLEEQSRKWRNKEVELTPLQKRVKELNNMVDGIYAGEGDYSGCNIDDLVPIIRELKTLTT